MTDLSSLDAYTDRFHETYRVTGRGQDTLASFPCPFCAEADWYEVRLVDFGEHMGPHYCTGCGRSSRFVFRQVVDGVQAELVQCHGPDAPVWMVPTPRREDRPDGRPHSEGFLVSPETRKSRLGTPPRMRGVDS